MNFRLLLAAAAAVLFFTPVQAEDCGPLKSFGTIALTEISGDTREFVPVELGGVPKLLLLDTGAAFTTMTQTTAGELKLQASSTEARYFDMAGGSKARFVTTSLKLGALRADKMSFALGTPYLDSAAQSSSNVAGLLGASILANYDASIDFGAHTLTLFSQDHCDGRVVYWPERPLTIVPFTYSGGSIVIPVTLDGHEFKAIVDSGADGSTLYDTKAWSTFGVGRPTGKPDDGTWRQHTFQKLSISGLEVANPVVYLIEDRSGSMNGWSTGTAIDRKMHEVPDLPPMLLGMNVLRHLHVYIAYREKKLYITPSSASASAAPATPAPTPAPQN